MALGTHERFRPTAGPRGMIGFRAQRRRHLVVLPMRFRFRTWVVPDEDAVVAGLVCGGDGGTWFCFSAKRRSVER